MCPSPLLFNLFLAVLANSLNDITTHPPKIGGKHLGCLFHAGNGLLMSRKKIGIQRLINTHQKYTDKNHLVVNLEMTKTMIIGNLIKKARECFFKWKQYFQSYHLHVFRCFNRQPRLIPAPKEIHPEQGRSCPKRFWKSGKAHYWTLLRPLTEVIRAKLIQTFPMARKPCVAEMCNFLIAEF